MGCGHSNTLQVARSQKVAGDIGGIKGAFIELIVNDENHSSKRLRNITVGGRMLPRIAVRWIEREIISREVEY